MTFIPELTIGVCVYRRPEYAMITLASLKNRLDYAGSIRFCIAGVFTDVERDAYARLLKDYQVDFIAAPNFAAMCNAIAHAAGDVWLNIVDDYLMHYRIDVTPDVNLLMERGDIGCVRLAQLGLWGDHPEDADCRTNADLIQHGGLHWWKIDKARTRDSYVVGIYCHLYHRRFWNDYGDIPECPPNNPGQGEINCALRFREKVDGCTVAIPMRFGEGTRDHPQPFFHFGAWHYDDYAEYAGARTRDVWFKREAI